MPRIKIPNTPAPVAPATLDRGDVLRHAACPRCHATALSREPAYDHCRLCGRLWPIRGAPLGAQVAFEAGSGLRSAGARG